MTSVTHVEETEATQDKMKAFRDDVYGGSIDEEQLEVLRIDNILDVKGSGGVQPHTLTVEVEDAPGVLNQVTGVFARRGYNVQSLAVGNSEKKGMSRITMVVPGTEAAIHTVVKQILRLVCVISVRDLTG